MGELESWESEREERERERVRGDRSFCARHFISLLLLSLARLHTPPPSHPRPEPLLSDRGGAATFVPINHHHHHHRCRRPTQTTHTLLLLRSRQSFFISVARWLITFVPFVYPPTCYPAVHPPTSSTAHHPFETFHGAGHPSRHISPCQPSSDWCTSDRRGLRPTEREAGSYHRDDRGALEIQRHSVWERDINQKASAVARSEGGRPNGSRDFLV